MKRDSSAGNAANKGAFSGFFAQKGARALAKADKILKGGEEAPLITDEYNTGKLARLVVWQVSSILADFRKKGYVARVQPDGGKLCGREKSGAPAGDFCYSICRQDREKTAGTV